MLIACEACHRQYDVSAHRPGSKVACSCGHINRVPTADDPGRGGELSMAHCSSCGAGVPAGATECGFCGGSIQLAERGYGDVCPHCLHRMAKDANFCGSCGQAVTPEVVPHALTSWNCPRCSAPLHERDAIDGRVVECHSCGGMWLDEHVFESVVKKRKSAHGLVRKAAPKSSVSKPTGPSATGPCATGPSATGPQAAGEQRMYLSCPVCSDLMHRRNFAQGSGVILDWCKDHGWWFDADELSRVLEFVEANGAPPTDPRRHAQRPDGATAVQSRPVSPHASQIIAGRAELLRVGRKPNRETGLLGTLAEFLDRFL